MAYGDYLPNGLKYGIYNPTGKTGYYGYGIFYRKNKNDAQANWERYTTIFDTKMCNEAYTLYNGEFIRAWFKPGTGISTRPIGFLENDDGIFFYAFRSERYTLDELYPNQSQTIPYKIKDLIEAYKLDITSQTYEFISDHAYVNFDGRLPHNDWALTENYTRTLRAKALPIGIYNDSLFALYCTLTNYIQDDWSTFGLNINGIRILEMNGDSVTEHEVSIVYKDSNNVEHNIVKLLNTTVRYYIDPIFTEVYFITENGHAVTSELAYTLVSDQDETFSVANTQLVIDLQNYKLMYIDINFAVEDPNRTQGTLTPRSRDCIKRVGNKYFWIGGTSYSNYSHTSEHPGCTYLNSYNDETMNVIYNDGWLSTSTIKTSINSSMASRSYTPYLISDNGMKYILHSAYDSQSVNPLYGYRYCSKLDSNGNIISTEDLNIYITDPISGGRTGPLYYRESIGYVYRTLAIVTSNRFVIRLGYSSNFDFVLNPDHALSFRFNNTYLSTTPAAADFPKSFLTKDGILLGAVDIISNYRLHDIFEFGFIDPINDISGNIYNQDLERPPS